MKLAVIADYAEEDWPSMDLCASELMRNIPPNVDASLIQPMMNMRLTRLLGKPNSNKSVHIVDRLWNRQWDYPRYARRELATRFDAFHIVDHSYASVAHALPAQRTGIYCHDLDAFRSILEPSTERRPHWFRAMSRRTMNGLMKASVVFHNSLQTGEALRRFHIVPDARLVHAPLGIAAEFCLEETNATSPAVRDRLDQIARRPILLHVGSNIPRKRIDVLLKVFDAVRNRVPEVVLVKIGDPWLPEQNATITELGIQESIIHLGKLERCDLAASYRRADAVLITSDAEGFGLPVIEAMACGSTVVASDIPVLRETGGEAALYAPVGEIDAWAATIEKVLVRESSVPSQNARIAWASRFSWAEHAKIIADTYQKLL